MRGLRFVVGRLRYSHDRAVQCVVFDSREFSERDARAWLLDHGMRARVLQRDGAVWRSRQRERAEFDPQSFRTIEPGRQEVVTMASNPKRKRRGKKRRAPKRRAATKRRRSARRRRKVSGSSRTRTGLRVNARRRRRRNPKTVRTDVRTVKVMRTNARKRRARPRRRSRSSSRYTLAFTPVAAKVFARIARLSKVRRREMARALRRHPSGGVYVALPAWHGSRDQAKRLAERVQLILAYAAGRRRASLTSSAAPRVVAVP